MAKKGLRAVALMLKNECHAILLLDGGRVVRAWAKMPMPPNVYDEYEAPGGPGEALGQIQKLLDSYPLPEVSAAAFSMSFCRVTEDDLSMMTGG